MWSYYGAKTNLIKSYPPPKYPDIIEPFAGSARYALQYFDRNILLVDKYPVIINIWKWLQSCSEKDILNMPRKLSHGAKLLVEDYDCQEQLDLMGFIVGCGMQSPKRTVGYRKTVDRPNHVNYNLKKIASNLFKIRHWEIRLGDYRHIENQKATWFIDPPYQFGGHCYVMSNKKIDFEELAKWSLSREGQIIVCENTKADWLPFKPIVAQRGSVHTTTEAIYSNHQTAYDMTQQSLFSSPVHSSYPELYDD